MSEDKRNGPTRLLTPITKPDGSMVWKSFTHNAAIGGEIRPAPDLPGLIIFVHGVNSEGEWYEPAERELCEGLNERLKLQRHLQLRRVPDLPFIRPGEKEASHRSIINAAGT